MSLTVWCGGEGTAGTLGNRTMFRSPVVNIGKDHVNLNQQVLIVMNGHLLLKRWGPTANSLDMMMQPGGMPQGPGEGTMLTMGQRSRHNWIKGN